MMLKYMVSISENTTYLKLITEIHHHIQAEKTSNHEASKHNQEIMLGRKCKLDTNVSTSEPSNNDSGNGKKNTNGNQEENIDGNNNRNFTPQQNQIPRFQNYTPFTIFKSPTLRGLTYPTG